MVKKSTIAATIAAAALSGFGAPAMAQSDAAPPNWLVNCTNTRADGGLECRMTQSIVLTESGQRILQVSFRKEPNERLPALMLTLPLGMFMPAGVVMEIDGSEVETLPIQTCDAAGCYAGLAITDEMFEDLSTGEAMVFVIQDLQKREIRLTSTLGGFGEAFDTMP